MIGSADSALDERFIAHLREGGRFAVAVQEDMGMRINEPWNCTPASEVDVRGGYLSWKGLSAFVDVGD